MNAECNLVICIISAASLIDRDYVKSVFDVLLSESICANSVSACAVNQDNALVTVVVEVCSGNCVAVFCCCLDFDSFVSVRISMIL